MWVELVAFPIAESHCLGRRPAQRRSVAAVDRWRELSDSGEYLVVEVQTRSAESASRQTSSCSREEAERPSPFRVPEVPAEMEAASLRLEASIQIVPV